MHLRNLVRTSRLAVAVLGALALAPAAAVASGPVWSIDSVANSTVAPGDTLYYYVTIRNVGDAPTNAPYHLTITLPSGMTSGGTSESPFVPAFGPCAGDGTQVVTCDLIDPSTTLAPFSSNTVRVAAVVDPSARGTLVARMDVTGGGAADASTVDPAVVTTATPRFGIDAFDSMTTDANGAPSMLAGGHPYEITTSIDWNSMTSPDSNTGPDAPVEPVKDVFVDLPVGFVGNPTVATRCSISDLANSEAQNARSLCPVDSQVGVVTIRRGGLPLDYPFPQTQLDGPIPLYNMDTPPNVPARFGFNVSGTVVTMDASVRGNDYGLSINVRDTPEAVALVGSAVTFWGTPADPSHDVERACPDQAPPADGGPTCAITAGAPAKAFLRNPTSCDSASTGLTYSMTTDSWSGSTDARSFTTHALPGYPFPMDLWGAPLGITGCESVPFDPTLTGAPTSAARAGAPTGFRFELSLPQSDDPNIPGESDLRTAVVTLPGSVNVSPSSAAGLAGCSPDQIDLNHQTDPTCPNASKIGTVSVETPLLDAPLTGSVYLATPHDNPFDSLLAIYIVAKGQGVFLKLPGRVDANPVTGQLTTTFDNNPQLPFRTLDLEFKDGPRAPLVAPPTCGTYTTHAVLTSWSGKTVSSDSSFDVSQASDGSACKALGFSPSFDAGTQNPIAGADSPFLLTTTRGDGDQQFQALTVDMPAGLTAKIANAVLCSDAQAAAGTCPAGTKIGDVTVGAGAGSNPFYITSGQAFLTGPYRGAPFGLSIVVPAVAGPFDLGTVVVRSALFVDKHTSAVTVVSDPLPTILQGIPLDVRDLRVSIDKPHFMVNPTSCAVKSVGGVITSTAGATANVSDRFQVGECANLAFKPHMVLAVGGKGHLRAGQVTPLSTRITMPAGDANLRYVRVTLPGTLNARLTVINDACTRAEFETDIAKCAHAKAGTAVAVTPLLRDPLRGNVYFVRNGHSIPDLFVALRGQVSFDLIGQITIVSNRYLRTTFATAPDVPIRSFALRLLGDSKHGSIGLVSNMCTAAAKKATAAVDFIGQNGKVSQLDEALRIRGCPKAKPKPKPKARRGRG